MAVFLTAVSLGTDASLPSQRADAQVTPGCAVDLTGLLGWWRGEDAVAAEVGPDLAGAPTFQSGVVGQTMVLGPDADLTAVSLPAVSEALTIEMWIRPESPGDDGRIQTLASRWDFPSQDDAARSYFLYLDGNSNLRFETDEITLRRPEVTIAHVPQLFDGAFHHVAATWDATSITLYVDGVVAASAPSQGGSLNAAASTPFRLGSKSGIGPPFRYEGLIDEPSIWSRALSAAEISEIQNRSSAGKCDFVPVEQARLTSPTSAANDRYGTSVGVNGSTVVVGAPFAGLFGQFTGTAIVYTGSGSGWTEQAQLVANDPQVGDRTGWSVDVSGDTIVTGSYANDAAGPDSGAGYVFFRTGTSWAQQAKLVPTDALGGDGIGYSVAIDGNTVVIASVADDGAGQDSGSAYIFVRDGSDWSQQAKLVADDAAAFDNFGTWVDIDGDTVVVGAAGDNEGPDFNTGSAYVFTRTGTVWTQQAKLVAPDAAAGDQFGFGVTIDGDRIGVGAPFDDDAGANSGSVHVFTRSGATWMSEAKIVALDAAAEDRFGTAVATNGSVLVVGAPRDGAAGSQRGSAYIYTRLGTSWSETTKLVPLDNEVGDQFGISVAISGDVIVGAHNDDVVGNNSGSAYVFAP
jgi:hypothetical protein